MAIYKEITGLKDGNAVAVTVNHDLTPTIIFAIKLAAGAADQLSLPNAYVTLKQLSMSPLALADVA